MLLVVLLMLLALVGNQASVRSLSAVTQIGRQQFALSRTLREKRDPKWCSPRQRWLLAAVWGVVLTWTRRPGP